MIRSALSLRLRTQPSERNRLDDGSKIPSHGIWFRINRLVPTLRGRFHIVSQYELIAGDLTQDPDPVGYVDVGILFSVGLEEVCLFIECKRLNVNGASLATEYVSKGMMRFVTGQYAPDLPIGAMIGYVMDGQVPEALDSVIRQIRSHLPALRCAESSIIFVAPGSIQYQPH